MALRSQLVESASVVLVIGATVGVLNVGSGRSAENSFSSSVKRTPALRVSRSDAAKSTDPNSAQDSVVCSWNAKPSWTLPARELKLNVSIRRSSSK